jgi:hypothetical protein
MDVMERTHFGQHGLSCYGCKLYDVQFGNVMELPETTFEKRQAKDLPAYQRLRRNGMQPPGTRNCAELETRAESQLEVQMGKLIDPKLLRTHQNEIAEGMWMAKELKVTPEDMRGWKDNAVEGQKK